MKIAINEYSLIRTIRYTVLIDRYLYRPRHRYFTAYQYCIQHKTNKIEIKQRESILTQFMYMFLYTQQVVLLLKKNTTLILMFRDVLKLFIVLNKVLGSKFGTKLFNNVPFYYNFMSVCNLSCQNKKDLL